jgi:hypothetical protein
LFPQSPTQFGRELYDLCQIAIYRRQKPKFRPAYCVHDVLPWHTHELVVSVYHQNTI